MYKFAFFLLAFTYTSIVNSPAFTAEHNQSTQIAGWDLYWSDEFNRSKIDDKYWTHDIGFGPSDDGWGVWGVQEYTSDIKNSYLKDGKLVIKAYYMGGPFDQRNFTSAKLTTQGKINFLYGKIAARIRMPYGKGIFPAFWMLGSNIDEVDWPYCGEIDIAEMFGGGKGKDDTNLGTIHFFDDINNNNTFHGGRKKLSGKLADQFHIYEIDWSENEIIWFVDGNEYHRESIDINTHPERSELHNEFFMIINLGVGAFFDAVGYPDESTLFPQTMEVDWIRVYRKAEGSKD